MIVNKVAAKDLIKVPLERYNLYDMDKSFLIHRVFVMGEEERKELEVVSLLTGNSYLPQVIDESLTPYDFTDMYTIGLIGHIFISDKVLNHLQHYIQKQFFPRK